MPYQVRYRIRNVHQEDVVLDFEDNLEAARQFATVTSFAGLHFAKLLEPTGEVRAYVRPEEKTL